MTGASERFAYCASNAAKSDSYRPTQRLLGRSMDLLHEESFMEAGETGPLKEILRRMWYSISAGCPQCGKENVASLDFRGECGAALDNADVDFLRQAHDGFFNASTPSIFDVIR